LDHAPAGSAAQAAEYYVGKVGFATRGRQRILLR